MVEKRKTRPINTTLYEDQILRLSLLSPGNISKLLRKILDKFLLSDKELDEQIKEYQERIKNIEDIKKLNRKQVLNPMDLTDNQKKELRKSKEMIFKNPSLINGRCKIFNQDFKTELTLSEFKEILRGVL